MDMLTVDLINPVTGDTIPNINANYHTSINVGPNGTLVMQTHIIAQVELDSSFNPVLDSNITGSKIDIG
jgi:hypothetical protein